MRRRGRFVWGLMVLWGMVLGAAWNLWAAALVFAPFAGERPVAPEVNPALVVRQERVVVQTEAVPMKVGETLLLPFFEDVTVEAVCTAVHEGSLGDALWEGRGKDRDDVRVLLAVGPETMAGTVRVGERLFHLRPLEGKVHVVREIVAAEPAVVDFVREPAVVEPAATAPQAAQSVMTPLLSLEWQVAGLVNQERRINKLHDLAWHDALFRAARGHSDDMATQNYFSHTSLDGRTPADRITAAGYSWNAYGENIAAGYSTPEAVMVGWMNSSGHRANILSTAFCDLGVGYAFNPSSQYRHYWTQNFGRQTGVTTCPPVPDPPLPGTEAFSPVGWVSSFYVAYWGRSADPDGRAYWVGLVEGGVLSAIEIAENFALSDEAKAAYAYFRSPSTATDADRRAFVEQVYRNLFNREPDAEGLLYWTTLLASGGTSPGRFIGDVINAAMTNHGSDWAAIRNKADVSNYFADRVAQKGLPWSETLRAHAVTVLQSVTADLVKVQEAMALVDTLLGGRP